jgi:hypothetical protein
VPVSASVRGPWGPPGPRGILAQPPTPDATLPRKLTSLKVRSIFEILKFGIWISIFEISILVLIFGNLGMVDLKMLIWFDGWWSVGGVLVDRV